MNQDIDSHRLRSDLALAVAELRPRKAKLRAPWPGPMAALQAEVLARARELTELHVLLAWCRGRRHLVSAPRWLRDLGRSDELEDVQRRIAERRAEDYRRPTSHAEVSA